MGRVKEFYFGDDEINDNSFDALYEDEQDSLFQALDPKEMKKAAKAATKHIQEDSIPESDDNEMYY